MDSRKEPVFSSCCDHHPSYDIMTQLTWFWLLNHLRAHSSRLAVKQGDGYLTNVTRDCCQNFQPDTPEDLFI